MTGSRTPTLNQAIANAVVRMHREVIGRGPTKARAFFRDAVVVVLMEDAMTDAERSLAAGEREDAVLAIRAQLQQTMRPRLAREIEALTGARVRAVMSASHVDPDLAVEIFVLDRPPAGTPHAAVSPWPVGVTPGSG